MPLQGQGKITGAIDPVSLNEPVVRHRFDGYTIGESCNSLRVQRVDGDRIRACQIT